MCSGESSDDSMLLAIESQYCTNCKADCGLYSGAVLNCHFNATNVKCGFSMTALSSHKSKFAHNMTFPIFSDSFFGVHLNLDDENRFNRPSKGSETRYASTSTSKNNFISA